MLPSMHCMEIHFTGREPARMHFTLIFVILERCSCFVCSTESGRFFLLRPLAIRKTGSLPELCVLTESQLHHVAGIASAHGNAQGVLSVQNRRQRCLSATGRLSLTCTHRCRKPEEGSAMRSSNGVAEYDADPPCIATLVLTLWNTSKWE